VSLACPTFSVVSIHAQRSKESLILRLIAPGIYRSAVLLSEYISRCSTVDELYTYAYDERTQRSLKVYSFPATVVVDRTYIEKFLNKVA